MEKNRFLSKLALVREKSAFDSQREFYKKSCQRRPFQLLELMVAAFILLVCIAPTMHIFTSMYKTQREVIRKNQRDHLAHQIHAKFIEQLYKREIPIDDLKENNPIVFSDDDLCTSLKKNGYRCMGTFTIARTRSEREQPVMHLGELVIELVDEGDKERPVERKVRKIAKSENKLTREGVYSYSIYIDRGVVDRNNRYIDNEVFLELPDSAVDKPTTDEDASAVKPKCITQRG